MQFVEGKKFNWEEIFELQENRKKMYEYKRGRMRLFQMGYIDDDEGNWSKRELDDLERKFEETKRVGTLEEIMKSHFLLKEVEPMTFYKDLFARKELQAKGQLEADGKYNLIAYELKPMKARGTEYRWADTGKLLSDNQIAYYLEHNKGTFYEEEGKPKSLFVETKKGNKVICIYSKGEQIQQGDKPLFKNNRFVISEGLEDLESLINESEGFCILSPISFCGKKKSKDNARYLYAMCIELDGLRVDDYGQGLEQGGFLNLMWSSGVSIPKPTYIVWSGNGIHLYYVFDKPIALYKGNVRHLSKWRRELTDVIWKDAFTSLYKKKDIQYESLFQSFRIPGTFTKKGLKNGTEKAKVFKFGEGQTVSLEYLLSFIYYDRLKHSMKRVEREEKDKVYLEQMKENEGKLSIAQMKAKWGEDWYERHFTKEGKPRKNPKRKYFETNRKFYDWFIDKIIAEVEEGHRYFSMWMAVAVAKKCGVSKKELRQDLENVMQAFNENEGKKTNVTFGDIEDALRSYDDDSLKLYKWEYICQWCNIPFEPSKRNGRPQKLHLQLARANLAILNEDNGKALQGRRTKKYQVEKYQKEHPNASMYRCQKDTKLSKNTIKKYWRKYDG